jgi:hypothetical protein
MREMWCASADDTEHGTRDTLIFILDSLFIGSQLM